MKADTERLSAADWTARLDEADELSHAEKAALTDFLRESPNHVRALIEHTFIREDLRTLSISERQVDQWVTEARAAAAGTVPFPSSAHLHDPHIPRDGRQMALARAGLGRRLSIAASLGAVLALGVLFAYFQMNVYATGFGEQRILTLADGSVVTLNTESRMKVDFSDRTRSIALLKGEAFFRVAHDPSRPFLVNAEQTVVRAVGTQFNVNMADRKTVVSVVDGVVKVSRSEDSQVTLRKGEEAQIDRPERSGGSARPPITKAETPAALHAASWTEGRLEFDGTPLAEVMSQFQRYREFEAEFDNDTTRHLKITGSFESHDPDSALAYIATIPGIDVEKRGPRSYFIHRH